MLSMRANLALLAVVALLVPQVARAGDPDETASGKKPAAKVASEPRVQLAILLDTSGSMSGLINQARTQLWKIVNELATTKQNGQVPRLEVALYEYGNNGLSMRNGYVRKISAFTDDLDRISAELFSLTTNGGQEYCGQVIAAATSELDWSIGDGDLKLIFVAGNEPFSQGSVDYKQACRNAVGKGITVNTIFCGPLDEGVRTGWQDGARLADGSYFNIDQDQQVAVIATPFDAELAQLSSRINKTYVAFGDADHRLRFLSRQEAQDTLALSAAPAAAAERAEFKGSGQYKASEWDLIDAVKEGRVKLEEVARDELPEAMQNMSLDEKQKFLKQKTEERDRIREQLRSLGDKRKAYLAEEQKKQAETDGETTLGAAIIESIREQAGRKNYEFDRE